MGAAASATTGGSTADAVASRVVAVEAGAAGAIAVGIGQSAWARRRARDTQSAAASDDGVAAWSAADTAAADAWAVGGVGSISDAGCDARKTGGRAGTVAASVVVFPAGAYIIGGRCQQQP